MQSELLSFWGADVEVRIRTATRTSGRLVVRSSSHLLSCVLSQSLRLLDPDAISELARSAKIKFVLLLKEPLLPVVIVVLVLLVLREVPKDSKDCVRNRVGRHIDILLADVIVSKPRTLKLILACWSKHLAILTVVAVRNNPEKHLVFQQETILVLLECQVKLQSSIMSTPRMVTLLAPELEESFLDSLLDLPLVAVPLPLVVDLIDLGKELERGPLHLNHHHLLPSSDRRHELLRQVPIHVVLNLLDGRAPLEVRVGAVGLLRNGCLEPVRDLKNVSLLELLVLLNLLENCLTELGHLRLLQALPSKVQVVAEE